MARQGRGISSISFSFRVAVGVAVLAASVTALVLGRKPPPVATQRIEARLELAAGDVTLKDRAARHGDLRPAAARRRRARHRQGGAGAGAALGRVGRLPPRGHGASRSAAPASSWRRGEVWLDAPASERGGLGAQARRRHGVGGGRGALAAARRRRGLGLRRARARGGDGARRPRRGQRRRAGRRRGRGEARGGAGQALGRLDRRHGRPRPGRPGTGERVGAHLRRRSQRGARARPARTLEISQQSVRAVIRDGLAETEVDQTFANPGGREVEGWYWFTVPERAVVTSFAVETDGEPRRGRGHREAGGGRAVRAGRPAARTSRRCSSGSTARATAPASSRCPRRDRGAWCCATWRWRAPAAASFEYVYPLRGSVGRAGDHRRVLAHRRPRRRGRRDARSRRSRTRSSRTAGASSPCGGAGTRRAPTSSSRGSLRGAGRALPRGAVLGRRRPRRLRDGALRAGRRLGRRSRSSRAISVVVVDTSASADEAARAAEDGRRRGRAARAVARRTTSRWSRSTRTPVVLYPKEEPRRGLREGDLPPRMERLAEHA